MHLLWPNQAGAWQANVLTSSEVRAAIARLPELLGAKSQRSVRPRQFLPRGCFPPALL